jgi:hypothetical protein
MNKGILIGIGVLMVAGIGGFFWWKNKNKSTSTGEGAFDTKSSDKITAPESTVNEPVMEQVENIAVEPASKKEARQIKRQTRRDCRAEAKSKGLKGKAKRQFKRECKAAGGTNADFVTNEADFAFNGFASFD